jgi:hypothetical protein
MARKQNKASKAADIASWSLSRSNKTRIVVVFLFIIGYFLSSLHLTEQALLGADAYRFFSLLLGRIFFLPLLRFVLAGTALRNKKIVLPYLKTIASASSLLAGLGFVAIVSNNGGFVGSLIAHPLVNRAKKLRLQRSRHSLGEYQAPPLNLLERDRGRPGVGDIKGNANIIKRTLQNFGITVELDEISIGPSVTRYAIKPAEGVRSKNCLAPN